MNIYYFVNYFQVEHPAAKIITMASEMQDKEVGDGTNFIIIFAGALLKEAEDLLRMVFRSLFNIYIRLSFI